MDRRVTRSRARYHLMERRAADAEECGTRHGRARNYAMVKLLSNCISCCLGGRPRTTPAPYFLLHRFICGGPYANVKHLDRNLVCAASAGPTQKSIPRHRPYKFLHLDKNPSSLNR